MEDTCGCEHTLELFYLAIGYSSSLNNALCISVCQTYLLDGVERRKRLKMSERHAFIISYYYTYKSLIQYSKTILGVR